MTCAFCGDDLVNHAQAFRSDTWGGLRGRRTVLICGTCVRFFELRMRADAADAAVTHVRNRQLESLQRWEDDGGPCLPA